MRAVRAHFVSIAYGDSGLQINYLWYLIILCIVLHGMAGCQVHERQPLDLDAHIEQWQHRSPTSDEVATFAQELATMRGGDDSAFDASDGISLHEAEIVALLFNSDLRLARLRAGVAAATAEHAGLWDDPQLGIDFARILESVNEPWVIAGKVAFTLPISGRLDAMRALADSKYATALQETAATEWDVVRKTREAWLDWSAARLQYELSEASVNELNDIAVTTRKLKESGEIDSTQAALFELELSRVRNESRRFAGAVRNSEATLRRTLGLSPSAPMQLIPQITFDAQTLQSDGSYSLLQKSNLRLQQRRLEYESSERRLALELKKQYPDLAIGPGYASDEGQSRALLGLSVPLPIFNANKQAIAEALAERDLARAVFETEYENLASDFDRARTRYETAQAILDDLETNVIPLIDRQMNDANRLIEIGEIDPLVLLESITRKYQAKLAIIDARHELSIAAVLMDEIVGPPFTETKQHDAEESR